MGRQIGTNRIRPRATCPECEQSRSLNGDGRMRVHGKQENGRSVGECPGTGRQPVQAPPPWPPHSDYDMDRVPL